MLRNTLKLTSALFVVLLLTLAIVVYSQDPVLDKVTFLPVVYQSLPDTPTPTVTSTPTKMPTKTPMVTSTPVSYQWFSFMTGYDDRKMKGLPTGRIRRSSLTNHWGDVIYPQGVFIVLFMDVVNYELTSGYVSRIDTFWMRDGYGPFFDMADLDVQLAAEDEYNRIGVYVDLQPQLVYEMVFVFDVSPQGSYSLWCRLWESVSTIKVGHELEHESIRHVKEKSQ